MNKITLVEENDGGKVVACVSPLRSSIVSPGNNFYWYATDGDTWFCDGEANSMEDGVRLARQAMEAR